jgi:hypothetical protein
VDDSLEALGTYVELLRTGLLQSPFHGRSYPHILLAIDCTNPLLSSGSPTRGEMYEWSGGNGVFPWLIDKTVFCTRVGGSQKREGEKSGERDVGVIRCRLVWGRRLVVSYGVYYPEWEILMSQLECRRSGRDTLQISGVSRLAIFSGALYRLCDVASMTSQ